MVIPWIVDSEIVKSKARDFVAEHTNGMTKIEKIDLFWFPRPGVMMKNVAIAFDKEIDANIQQLTLYPSIRHLLTGRFAFSRITADGAAWRVRLADHPDTPFNLAELEKKIHQLIKNLALVVPGTNLQLRHGMLDISNAGGPSVMITDLDANLGVTLDKLALTMTAGANVADRIRLSGELATNNLASEARLSVANLGLRKILDFYSPGAAGWIADGAATLTVNLKAAGLKSVSAEVTGSAPSLTLARGARKTPIAAKDFKAVVTGDEKVFRVALESLDLVSPPLKATGEVNFDRPSSAWSVMLAGRDFNVGAIRKSALLVADDITSVHNLFRYLQDGTIADVRVDARGRSIAEVLESKQAVVTANLRGVKIFVPGAALDLADVAGSMKISAGVIECLKCSATLGKAKGRDGTLRVGLAGAGAPFHLDIMVDADARELQTLLLRQVKDEAFRKEVSRFHDLDGSLSGRLVLGETLDAISAQAFAVQPALKATYEAVPYPVSLKGGRFNYANGRIETESLEGAIGRSSFSGLTGSVRADWTGQLNIKSASVQLDLQDTEVLFRKIETLQAKLDPESAARGKIDFSAISLRGPLNDPSRWNFSGRGKVAGLWIKHRLLPDPITISQGNFNASPDKITFAKTKMQMLDASLSCGGVVNNWRKAPLSMEAKGSGVAGQRMMEWLRRQTEIPADYMPRSPLQISSGHLAWRDNGDLSFQGKLTVANGPRLSVDIVRTVPSFIVKELLIDDAHQSARATFELLKDKWALTFRGNLIQPTLDKIFVRAPVRIGLLQGNFSVNASRKPPFGLSALGALAAEDIDPLAKRVNAVLERIIVQADPSGVNIRSAALRWRGSRISAMGKLTAPQDALQVDMDVSADRLVWEEINAIAGAADGQAAQDSRQVAAPTVRGVIRLKADRFDIATLSWAPLQLTAQLTATGIDAVIQNGVACGIRTAGRFTVQKNDQVDLDLRLSAKDGALESTTRCLSSDKSNISGTYSVDARLTGRGSAARLAQSLSGEFDFVARDGKVIRAEGVDATFDYLNDSGNFNVAFPDLTYAAMAYSLISGKGTVEGQSVFASELIIEASPYAITAQGKADFQRNLIDGKGLVTVLMPASKILKSIPLIGSIVSGSIIGIPVSVSGSLERPDVSYLSPAALGAELVNIPLRILKLPLGMLQFFSPSGPETEKP
jgi:hypothetical protein